MRYKLFHASEIDATTKKQKAACITGERSKIRLLGEKMKSMITLIKIGTTLISKNLIEILFKKVNRIISPEINPILNNRKRAFLTMLMIVSKDVISTKVVFPQIYEIVIIVKDT